LSVNDVQAINLFNNKLIVNKGVPMNTDTGAENPIFASESKNNVEQFPDSANANGQGSVVDEMKKDLEKTKSDQGIISKAWDGIKNFFGAKTGSSNVEKTIEKLEKGEITEDEARQVLDEYKNAQSTFTDKLSGIISTVGLIGTVAGAVLSLIPGGQVIGVPLLAISGKVALGGMFVDNALDLVDKSTDADGLTSNEFKDLALETGVEAVAYVAGRGIGKLTGNIHTSISNKLIANGTNEIASKAIGYAGEALTDGALSLTADYGITQAQSLIATGETVAWKDYWSLDRFTSEGRSQLIGILTGVATSKQYPAGSVAPATTGAKVASDGVEVVSTKGIEAIPAKGVDTDVSANKLVNTETQANAPRRLMFNPETGELTPAKPQHEVKTEPLDCPVAGDDIGLNLRIKDKNIEESSSLNVAKNTDDITRRRIEADEMWETNPDYDYWRHNVYENIGAWELIDETDFRIVKKENIPDASNLNFDYVSLSKLGINNLVLATNEKGVRGSTIFAKNNRKHLHNLKQNGIEQVIDLRTESNVDRCIQQCAYNELGYTSFPIYYAKKLTVDEVNLTREKMPQFIQAMENGKFYIGCSEGTNRTDTAFAINYLFNPNEKIVPVFVSQKPQKSLQMSTNFARQILGRGTDQRYDFPESFIRSLGWESSDSFLIEFERRLKNIGLANT